MRYKAHLAYLGTNYEGFQSQKSGKGIQDYIERALKIIFNQDIRIIMASRTDSGVHAYEQIIHFDAEDRDLRKLKYSLNSLLPKDIHIWNLEYVNADFHCRYLVKEKTYLYLINDGEYDVFLDGRAYQCHLNLDYKKMLAVAKLYEGYHNFAAFNTTPLNIKENQYRTIKSCKVIKKKNRYYILVTGDGFLRHMVRIMVGTMVEVACGRKELTNVEKMLSSGDKEKRRYNIDACGLYLYKIKY